MSKSLTNRQHWQTKEEMQQHESGPGRDQFTATFHGPIAAREAEGYSGGGGLSTELSPLF